MAASDGPRAYPLGGEGVATAADFGCTEFEAREAPTTASLIRQVAEFDYAQRQFLQELRSGTDPDFNETPCPHCGPAVVDQGTGYGHRGDCPTFTEPHAIVRELAKSDVCHIDEGYYFCGLCNVESGTSIAPLMNPTNHEPSCLWRRALELYPPAE